MTSQQEGSFKVHAPLPTPESWAKAACPGAGAGRRGARDERMLGRKEAEGAGVLPFTLRGGSRCTEGKTSCPMKGPERKHPARTSC